jgi:hypothetical protein
LGTVSTFYFLFPIAINSQELAKAFDEEKAEIFLTPLI